MRYLLWPALAAVLATTAYAQSPDCRSAAAQKNLSGAALSSFMKKCESDARSACSRSASRKKLSGAARADFTASCVRERVGG
jgi:hypothetical protein